MRSRERGGCLLFLAGLLLSAVIFWGAVIYVVAAVVHELEVGWHL